MLLSEGSRRLQLSDSGHLIAITYDSYVSMHIKHCFALQPNKAPRGYHPRSLNSNDGWNVTGTQSFLNMPINTYIPEIQNAIMLIHGERAHSVYFSKDAYKRLQGQNKLLMIIPDAVHTGLYDQLDVIPFDRM